jgi:hypothetical protein
MRHSAIQLLIIALVLGPISLVRADGGTVRLSERQGAYQVTVFTQPTPCRAGPVDVTVLLQDAAASEPITDAQVTLTATPANGTRPPVTMSAEAGSATNRLLYGALLNLAEPGQWRIEVAIAGRQGTTNTAFDLEVLEPLPAWIDFAGWIGWPAGAVVLFALHQVLARRQRAGE